jgi:proline dehydrogenase
VTSPATARARRSRIAPVAPVAACRGLDPVVRGLLEFASTDHDEPRFAASSQTTVFRDALLRLSTRPAIGRSLERLPVSRRVVRRFVAGQAPGDALAVLERLEADGLETAVTYLGEHVTTAEAAAAAADVYCGLLEEARRRGLRATPSVKLTHLGIDLGEDVASRNVERILSAAGDTWVWLDMEGSAYTDRTLALYRQLRRRWRNVACVLQAYLYRTEGDLRGLVAGGLRVRLCKGAYREPASRAFPRKADVDRNYARLAGMLLSREARAAGVYPAFATHDERLARVIADRAREFGITPDRYEFQMLHGVRPDLHRPFLAMGVRLRVLVPFGEDWYGYFVRRLAERPANLLFFLGQLARR